MQRKLLYGFHPVMLRLKRFPDSVLTLYCLEGRQDARMEALITLGQTLARSIQPVNKATLDQMTHGAVHQGVAALINADVIAHSIEEVLDTIDELPLLLILDEVTDPHNLGACLRVADAMGAHAVLAPKDNSASINATVAKVACGAADVVPYIKVTNLARLLTQLKQQGIWIIGAAADAATDLFHFQHREAIAWVLGAEGKGIRRLTREHCDMLVRIPMFGAVESLNVSVASGICLAESRRQRMV